MCMPSGERGAVLFFANKNNEYLIVLLVCTMAGLPPWLVDFPPTVDLPQHLAQIYQLNELLSGRGGGDVVMTPWYYANTLVYFLMFLLWKIVSPLVVGKAIVSLLLFFSAFSLWGLCRSSGRSLESWLVATPFVFGLPLYWGFLNFLIGWPFFCLFLVVVQRWRNIASEWFLVAVVGLLLYFSHSLWFLLANVWLAVILLEKGWRLRFHYFSTLLPAWVLAAFWFPRLAQSRAESGVKTDIQWLTMPVSRFVDIDAFVRSALWEIPGGIHYWIVFLALSWVFFSFVISWKDIARQIDKSIFCAAILLLLGYFVFPNNYMNTIFFNARWLPYALMLLLISLPSPASFILSVLSLRLLGFLIATLCFGLIARAWVNYEKDDLSGFKESLALIGKSDRVLGLDLYRSGNYLTVPLLQHFAYAQALNGADLSFSFNEHYSGIVQYKVGVNHPWPREVLWRPATVKKADLQYFDCILVSGDSRIHDFVANKFSLVNLGGGTGIWRLYRPPVSFRNR